MGLFDLLDFPQAPQDSDWIPEAPPSLNGIDHIQLDCETDGLDWRGGRRPGGISICRPDGYTQYMPFRHQSGPNLDEAVVKRWAQTELRNKRIDNVATKFDIHMLREWGVDLEAQGCTVSDVAFDAALLDDYREHFSLKVLCEDYLLEHERKVTSVGGITLDPNRMMEYPSDMIAVRGMADVRQVYLLRKVFDPLIERQHLDRVRQLEYDCIFPVCEMERLGAPINVELLHRWVKESEQLLHRWMLELAQEAGFQMSPTKTADWERLLVKLGVEINAVTESVICQGCGKKYKPAGSPKCPKCKSDQYTEVTSYSDGVLKKIGHPTVQKARMVKKLENLRSKYLVPYSQTTPDGILWYELHQLRTDDYGTNRGRFSSSNHNIQQVPDPEKQVEEFEDLQFIIRELLTAGEGLYLAADARQIEFRLFACEANSKKFNAAYDKDPGLSFHDFVHAMIQKFKPDLPYKQAKNTNFAKIYCAGKDKVSAMIGVPRPEADHFVDLYDQEFPEVKQATYAAIGIAEKRGYITTILGRRARYPEKMKQWSYKALNARISGSAADIMKQKIVELHKLRKWTGFVMRYTIHDAVNGDAPDLVSAAKVRTVLNWQSFRTRIPILWAVEVGQNWAHTKKIGPMIVEEYGKDVSDVLSDDCGQHLFDKAAA